MRWVEKEEVQDWLGIADLNRPIHTINPELSSVANILLSFQNPPLPEAESSQNDANATSGEQFSLPPKILADSIVFDLGTPSAFLRSAGVHDKPMKLYGSKIIKKQKKHGFRLEELRGLPMAMADPIAVFDNHGTEGNRSILTELSTNDGNVLVSLDLGKGTDIDFNIISSAFGKNGRKILHWINKAGWTKSRMILL